MGVEHMGEACVEEADRVPIEEKSMFGMMTKHDDMLDEHDRQLEEHALQLRIQAEQIKQLQDNGIRLENVVMTENRETRLTITNTNQQLHELINGIMGFKSGQNQITHTLKLAKLEAWSKIVAYLAGSGGLIYFLLDKM